MTLRLYFLIFVTFVGFGRLSLCQPNTVLTAEQQQIEALVHKNLQELSDCDAVTQGAVQGFMSHMFAVPDPVQESLKETLKDPAHPITQKFIKLFTQRALAVVKAEQSKRYLQAVAQATLRASFATALLSSLSVVTGNMSSDVALQTVVAYVLLFGSEAIGRLALQEAITLPTGSPVSAALATQNRMLVQKAVSVLPQSNASFCHGICSLVTKEATRSVMCSSLEAACFSLISTQVIEKVLEAEGGFQNICVSMLNNAQWFGGLKSPDTGVVAQEENLTWVFSKLHQGFLDNKEKQQFLASIVSSALQGSLVALIMQSIGCGFYFESGLVDVVGNAALVGAAEGLMHYLTYGTKNVGLLSDLFTGGVLCVGRLHALGLEPTLATTTSFVVHKTVSNVIDQTVVKQGGWQNLAKRIFSPALADVYSFSSPSSWFSAIGSGIRSKMPEFGTLISELNRSKSIL